MPVDLVWLNKASIPNFSFLGSLEVTQIYLPGWGGWSHTDYMTNLSSRLNLHWTGKLELSLAKSKIVNISETIETSEIFEIFEIVEISEIVDIS